jgi:hypothetical protein
VGLELDALPRSEAGEEDVIVDGARRAKAQGAGLLLFSRIFVVVFRF